MADDLLEIVKTFDQGFDLKYNKFYIGLAKNGQPSNFAVFHPQKNSLRLDIRLPRTEETETQLEDVGLDVMDYDQKRNSHRLRLSRGDLKKHSDLLTDVLHSAYENFGV
jgi:predicted transport protein